MHQAQAKARHIDVLICTVELALATLKARETVRISMLEAVWLPCDWFAIAEWWTSGAGCVVRHTAAAEVVYTRQPAWPGVAHRRLTSVMTVDLFFQQLSEPMPDI